MGGRGEQQWWEQYSDLNHMAILYLHAAQGSNLLGIGLIWGRGELRQDDSIVAGEHVRAPLA